MELRDKIIYTILLADDDFDDKDIFCAAVKEVDPQIQIQTVNSGLELLQVLQKQSVDLLFLDINMFPVNGIEALKAIREQKDYEQMPVVMFSSSGRPSDVRQSYQLGASLFIQKTETFQELKEVLKKALELNWKEADKIRSQFYDTCFTAN